jgi:predicted N-acyltransferase
MPAAPGAQLGAESGIEVRLFRDVNEVPAAAWDGLLDPDDLQQSHRFVRLCQESRVEDADSWHLMLYQGERLCATATLSRMYARLDLLSSGLPRGLVGAVRRAWPGFLRVPVLFCGLPVSFGQPCLKLAPWADAAAVCRALVGTMDRVARATGTGLLCLKEFDPAGAGRLEPLCGEGFFRAPSLSSWSLPLPWDSFASYLGAMTAGYRRQVRATLKARDAAGLEVRRADRFAADAGTIFALYEQVIRRARFRLETLNRAFVERLASDLGEQARAIVVERAGRPLAAAVLLRTPNVVTFLLAGLDYDADPGWQVYPNLVVEVVAEAIHSGASRLEMGQTSHLLKSRLGAVEEPRSVFLRHRHPAKHSLLRRAAPLLFPEQDYPPRRVFREGVAEP